MQDTNPSLPWIRRLLQVKLFRFLLAILLLAVGLRFALELVIEPQEPFSITVQELRE